MNLLKPLQYHIIFILTIVILSISVTRVSYVYLLTACQKSGAGCLVYTSTYNVVFGGQEIQNGDESMQYLPLDKVIVFFRVGSLVLWNWFGLVLMNHLFKWLVLFSAFMPMAHTIVRIKSLFYMARRHRAAILLMRKWSKEKYLFLVENGSFSSV